MAKIINQVLSQPETPMFDLGLFKIEVCGPLADITEAAKLPNYRLEIASMGSHERGTIFLRIHDSTYDQDKHDPTLLHSVTRDVLETIIEDDGTAPYRLVPTNFLQNYDRSTLSNPAVRREWTPDQAELRSYNAYAVLAVANQKEMPVHGGWHVRNGSSITLERPDTKAGRFRFDLLLDGGLRFYAVAKQHATHNFVPMPYAVDFDPNERYGKANGASTVQGEFVFQGQDYAFTFFHSLFPESLTGIFGKRLLINALDEGIAAQFPFFMPPRGADVGVKLINLTFK
ncbi:hypothetical protein [Burkholderia phage FLC9]|nr:hypothetical protein [Burkholderia phage FLC9]